MPKTKLAKKAAKKVAKKAAKKTPKGPGHEARRAYEHLQRLRILHTMVSPEVNGQMITLSQFAQASFRNDEPKSAAELLRAAEHLAFGSLATEEADENVHSALKQEMRDEFHHQLEKAAEKWDEQEAKPAREIKAIYREMRTGAKTSWKSKAYHRALELARGAAVLAHTKTGGLKLEPSPSSESGLLEGEQS